jgi:hypothetical protein
MDNRYRTFEAKYWWIFRTSKMQPLCCIVNIMPVKDCRAMGSWIKYVGMLMSDSELKWYNQTCIWQKTSWTGGLEDEITAILRNVGSYLLFHRRIFQPDLNNQLYCLEKLISHLHITGCCNTTEVLSIFTFQSKHILYQNTVSGTTDVGAQDTKLLEYCCGLQLYFR